MIFCDVHNTGHKDAKSHFIIARDKKHAKEIAGTFPGIPQGVTILPPEDNIQELMDSGKTGVLAKKIQMIRGFDLVNIMMGKQNEPKEIQRPWFFIQEIN